MSAGDAGHICLYRRWCLVSAGDAQCSSAVFGGVCARGCELRKLGSSLVMTLAGEQSPGFTAQPVGSASWYLVLGTF